MLFWKSSGFDDEFSCKGNYYVQILSECSTHPGFKYLSERFEKYLPFQIHHAAKDDILDEAVPWLS
jgi:hypothetical protein